MAKESCMPLGILRPHVRIGSTTLTLIGHGMPTDILWCVEKLGDMNHSTTMSHVSRVRVKGFTIADFCAEYEKKHGERTFNGAFAVQAEWNQAERAFIITWSRDLHRFPIGFVLKDEERKRKKPIPKVHPS